jgi:hypothetical protein
MATSTGDFSKNVFINCPFDDQYLELLRPLLFTILFLGFRPRIASERLDSLESRIQKICGLIRESRYSIHDLSRLKASHVGEFYRMNMPFELGIEYGCRLFGAEPLPEKRCLILEKDPHEFRKALSDLSGIDILHHENEPTRVVQVVRNWLCGAARLSSVLGPTGIWYRFNDFTSDFYDKRKGKGFSHDDLNMMPVTEYIDFIARWLDHQSDS